MGFLEEEKNISLLKTKLMLVILNSGIFFRKNATQQLDHFPTMIGSPHNHWIITPQWLDPPTNIG